MSTLEITRIGKVNSIVKFKDIKKHEVFTSNQGLYIKGYSMGSMLNALHLRTGNFVNMELDQEVQRVKATLTWELE